MYRSDVSIAIFSHWVSIDRPTDDKVWRRRHHTLTTTKTIKMIFVDNYMKCHYENCACAVCVRLCVAVASIFWITQPNWSLRENDVFIRYFNRFLARILQTVRLANYFAFWYLERNQNKRTWGFLLSLFLENNYKLKRFATESRILTER